MKRTGKVLRIEKTSIHDGEGLRTVVFLKGCPLRCKWCSTPESQKMEEEFGYGVEMTPEEVVAEVCKDEIFFFHSGGGVTISGGEVLLQADFAREILKGCLEQGISTAIETSLFGDFAQVEKLLPYLQDVYVDMKLFSEERHQFYTGVSNASIKENLKKLDQCFLGAIHVRIPVVPTVNLSWENMAQTAEFLKNFRRVKDVELLPYHRLGLNTYAKMGRVYEMKDIEPPTQQEMREMAAVFGEIVPQMPVKIKGEPVGEMT